MQGPKLPPAGRVYRTGFARRDANAALLGAFFAGLVLAIALFLLIVQRVNPDQFSALRGSMADALTPVVSIVRTPVNIVRKTSQNISLGWQATRKNKALTRELELTRRQAAAASQLALEVDRLQMLLRMRSPKRTLVASGVASAMAPSGTVRSAIVSAGHQDGVRPGMPVIGTKGLAGRITDVGQISSRMMLLTDGNSRVPVIVRRTGWSGLVIGDGATLRFVFDMASETDHLRVGDHLVTSGDGGLFPPGIPVATITDIDSAPPTASPEANPGNLGPVMIERAWLRPPADTIATDEKAAPSLQAGPQ